jgi:hypothetical protein
LSVPPETAAVDVLVVPVAAGPLEVVVDDELDPHAASPTVTETAIAAKLMRFCT